MAYIKPPVLTRRLADPMAMRLGCAASPRSLFLVGAPASRTRFR